MTRSRYEVCLFDKVRQREGSSGRWASLGRWGGGDAAIPTTHSAQVVGASKPPEELRVAAVLGYEGGDRCYNGPARSARVQLTCGEEHAVLSVAEPDVCTYQIHMTSPAVCSAEDDIPKILGDETEVAAAAAPHQDL
jgi:protein kinase C substrate 80K-H